MCEHIADTVSSGYEKFPMPSEKAKENKNLVATCVACGKPVSTESMVSLRGREDGVAKSWSVCVLCANKGWRPPGFAGVYAARPE